MSQALYRRYRPEQFGDLIGQEHVTGPLVEAIKHDRVNHAYLFSGPRGCGKTTSARILARCLNCEQGPTPEPCGECNSCIDLARNGGGSLDVIEIDAASHGGVDDARELRERAFFAPASSRYKVYIIDEAHMVSKQGFNALLKLVEEPPEFVKFIFATTEPDAVIGTIRSRTHHYPFRLVGARTLETYLGQVCESEGVTVQPGVLPLVVRAGAGSVRDAMSVLDQLIGGSVGNEVTYDRAVSLLGFTPAALLDEMVDAIASSDGAGVFAAVDTVIDSGLDPRRFLEDLLQRLRDLVIVAAVPDAFSSGLVAAPDDQRDRMVACAERLGLAALTRAADLAAAGLTELRGATAPRLQLELVCAKLLLPGAHGDELGLSARLERLERRLSIGGVPEPAAASSAAATRAESTDTAAPNRTPSPEAAAGTRGRPLPSDVGAGSQRAVGGAISDPGAAVAERVVSEALPGSDIESAGTAPVTVNDSSEPDPDTEQPEGGVEPTMTAGAVDLHEIRRLWPNVLEQIKQYRRAVWMMLFEKSQVLDVDERVLTLGMRDLGGVRNLTSGGKDEIVRQAVIDVLGLDRTILAVHDPSLSATTAGAAATSEPAAPTPAPAPARSNPAAAADARAAAAAVDGPSVGQSRGEPAIDDEATADDAEDEANGLAGAELVMQQLGGKVIGEIDHT